jgi:hypothetical protein
MYHTLKEIYETRSKRGKGVREGREQQGEMAQTMYTI